jgi:hypothetical protein
LTGEQLAIVPEGFDTTHQRLTHIRWAPIKAVLADSTKDRDEKGVE